MKAPYKKQTATLPGANPPSRASDASSLSARSKVKAPRAAAGDAAAAFDQPASSNFWPCVFTLIKVIVGAGECSPRLGIVHVPGAMLAVQVSS